MRRLLYEDPEASDEEIKTVEEIRMKIQILLRPGQQDFVEEMDPDHIVPRQTELTDILADFLLCIELRLVRPETAERCGGLRGSEETNRPLRTLLKCEMTVPVDDDPSVSSGRLSVVQEREIKRGPGDHAAFRRKRQNLPHRTGPHHKRFVFRNRIIGIGESCPQDDPVCGGTRLLFEPDAPHGTDLLQREAGEIDSDLIAAARAPQRDRKGIRALQRHPPVGDVASVDDPQLLRTGGSVKQDPSDRRIGIGERQRMQHIEILCGPLPFPELDFRRMQPVGETAVGKCHHAFSAVLLRADQMERDIAEDGLFPAEFCSIVLRSLIGPSPLPVSGDGILVSHVCHAGEIQHRISGFHLQTAVADHSAAALNPEKQIRGDNVLRNIE